MPFFRFAAAVVLIAPWAASAFEESVSREEVDAGVHMPVLTKPPELLSFVEAAYPPAAQQTRLTASVKLVITIAADGTVSEATVPEPVGNGFDEAAIEAVRQFIFSPGEVDHQAAPVQLEYVYHFTLREPPKEEAPPPPPPKATLKGQLIARGSRTRVEAGMVRCGDDAQAPEALSDAQGMFSLEVAPGECQVTVAANGYQLFKTTEKLEAGETREVVYHVIPQAVGYETVVRAKREKKEVVRRTLERQELQKVPGSFGDPLRVLQNFPGVARAPFISGALIVRGASPDQTATLLDGVEIPILYHLGGGPSVVNGEFLDRIDFYPGGFGARYGRAVGGVVDVATRQGASDTFHGSVKVDLQDSGFFLEAPLADGVSVAAAARRSYVDALIPLVLPQDPEGGSLLILPQYWDYQARLDLGAKRGDGASTFSVMAFGSDDLLKVVATGGGRNRDVTIDVHTVFHRVVGNWTYRKGNATFSLTPFVGYDLASILFGEASIKAAEYELGVREDLTLVLAPWLTARFGADVLLDHLAGEAELPVLSGVQYVGFPGAEPKLESQSVARELESFDAAAYAEVDLKYGDFTLTPGLRASTSFLNGEKRSKLEPRLWMRQALTPQTALKASVGLYAQAPEASELEPPPFGNADLTHEQAFQASFGVEQRLTDALSLDLTGFYNRRFDNIVSPGRTVANADGSVTTTRLSNDLLGRAFGLEALLRHDVTKHFFGWIAYTLNRSEERRVGAFDYRLTENDQTHILTAVGSYRLPFGFEVGARFRYVTGRPKTPLAHQADLYNADSNSFAATVGPVRSTRFRDFNQLDLRVDKSFLFQSWTLTAYVDVQNVYNAKNVEATFFDYRFREEVEVPGIPILPIVGVKGTF
ncbi:MAG: TonB family protein [Myxococcota bacterium]